MAIPVLSQVGLPGLQPREFFSRCPCLLRAVLYAPWRRRRGLLDRDGCGLGRTLLALAWWLAGSKAGGLGRALLAPVRGLARGAASGLGRMLLGLVRGLGRRAAWALRWMLPTLVRRRAGSKAWGLGRALLAMIRVCPSPPGASGTGLAARGWEVLLMALGTRLATRGAALVPLLWIR